MEEFKKYVTNKENSLSPIESKIEKLQSQIKDTENEIDAASLDRKSNEKRALKKKLSTLKKTLEKANKEKNEFNKTADKIKKRYKSFESLKNNKIALINKLDKLGKLKTNLTIIQGREQKIIAQSNELLDALLNGENYKVSEFEDEDTLVSGEIASKEAEFLVQKLASTLKQIQGAKNIEAGVTLWNEFVQNEQAQPLLEKIKSEDSTFEIGNEDLYFVAKDYFYKPPKVIFEKGTADIAPNYMSRTEKAIDQLAFASLMPFELFVFILPLILAPVALPILAICGPLAIRNHKAY